MAALGAQQILKVWADGVADKAVLFAMRKVTTGDTADLSGEFLIVKQAAFLGATVSGVAAGSIAGNVVTVPAGLANDAAWLLAWGCSA